MATAAPSVLHVIPQLAGGGAGNGALTICSRLKRYRSRFCVLNGAKAPASDLEVVKNPILLEYDGAPRDIPNLIRSVKALRSVVREGNFDIVHSHLWPATRISALATTGFKTRHVSHIRDTRPWLVDDSPRSKVFRLYTRLCLSIKPTHFMSVSSGAKEYTIGALNIDSEAVTVVPNSIDTHRFEYSGGTCPNQPFTIGMAGRFRPEKGHTDMLKAAALLAGQNIPFRLLLAGTGSEEEVLREKVQKLGIQDQVDFLGYVHDMNAFYRRLDVLVLASTGCEGLPRVILESMACGVPTVATDVAGVREAVVEGETGYVVPPSRPDMLFDRLSKIAGGKGVQHMRKGAHKRVKAHFHLDTMIDHIEETYDNLLTNSLTTT